MLAVNQRAVVTRRGRRREGRRSVCVCVGVFVAAVGSQTRVKVAVFLVERGTDAPASLGLLQLIVASSGYPAQAAGAPESRRAINKTHSLCAKCDI